MEVLVPLILQLVNLCVVGFTFTVQGSTGHNISSSPASFSLIPPLEGAPGPVHVRKSLIGNPASSAFQANGLDLEPPAALPPLASTPVPRTEPSLSPSTPTTVTSPHNMVPPPIVKGHSPLLSPAYGMTPPPLNVEGHEPSLPPSTPTVFPQPHDTTPAPSIVHGHKELLSPSSPSVFPPPHEITPPPSIVQGNEPLSSPHIPIVSPPYETAPPPLILGGHVSPPTAAAPYNFSPPPVGAQGHIPSLPPPVAMPSMIPPKIAPAIQPHGTLPPTGHKTNLSDNKSPIPEPIAPVVSPQKTPPTGVLGHIPSLPPNVPEERLPINENHVPPSSASVAKPSTMSPQVAPAIQPGTLPPNAHSPDNKSPIPEPIAPVISPPRHSGQTPQAAQPVLPEITPPVLPAPVASPMGELPQNSSASPPVMPGKSPSIMPDPHVSPTSTPSPSIDLKKHGIPVAAPPTETPKPLSPLNHSPTEAPSTHKTRRHFDDAPFPSPSSMFPPNEGYHSPASSPSTSSVPLPSPSSKYPPYGGHHSPESSLPTPPHNARRHAHDAPFSSPLKSPPNKEYHSPASAPSTSPHKAMRHPYVAPFLSPLKSPPDAGYHSPASSPSIPHHEAVRHPNDAPFSSPVKSPPNEGYQSPASSPSTPSQKPHRMRNKTISPSPASSYVVSPPASEQQGPVISPANFRTSRRTHYAPPPFNQVSSLSPSHPPLPSSVSHVSPVPSPAPEASSGHSEMPDLSPKVSPSGLLPKSPEMPPLPLIQALPPPPPNEDCAATICTDPYTNTPPGAPCGCVLPMQIGLRLNVAVYTFFPLVSELAKEIAAGVFMKQSQVRIMGANAASQQPEKTVVLIDLVPLGNKFDNTTALLTFQRFWHKQVAIKASYFGDYEVLYVRYPGLPASPPLPPSSIIDSGPYNGNDDARTIKPLGVDVRKRQHNKGLGRGMVAIIVLSASVILILGSAVICVFLFKHRDHACLQAPAPQPSRSSLAKPSGTARSITGSGLSSASLSFGSSIATYTGSAKTFSTSELEKATDNFNSSRILGEGGFGRVYSGVLEDGTKVAVKVLKRDDQQGGREFLAEVEMLSRLHHRNLVKLIGICTEEHARCLVYELIPNGSVESHLHGVDKESAPLDWDARIKIALGASRGLAYLHEDSSPRVIHRDFKASNILLEHDFTPKVSDFGLARTAMDEESRHISTRVMGTFGYVAPEYAMTGHLLVKSDVYSYGVVLLELLTGRKPVDMSRPPGQENLVAWAHPFLTSKEGLETIIDPSLGHDIPFDSVAKVAAIASMCVQPEVSHRPFMGEVVQALKLVCNECDEAKEVASRCSCQDDFSIDVEARVSTSSGQLADPLQSQYSGPNYESGLDPEKGLSASDLFGTSARLGRQESGSFRRHSSSGPLRTGRSKRSWKKLRRFSGGSVSEHRFMFKLRPGSH